MKYLRFRSSSKAVVHAFLTSALLAACTYPRTQTVIEVRADARVMAEADEVRMEVLDRGGEILFSRVVGVRLSDFPGFPIELPVASKNGDAMRSFEVRVVATTRRRQGNDLFTTVLAQNRARTGFRRGEVLRFTLWLLSGCRCNVENERCEPDADDDQVPECVSQTIDTQVPDASVPEDAFDAGLDGVVNNTRDAGSDGDVRDGTVVEVGPNCSISQRVCDGRCVSVNSPIACGPSCARCESIAGGTPTCDNNVCGIECGSATPDRCANACVNIESDTQNCGACDNVCASGQLCVNRQCQAPPQCTRAQDPACTGMSYCNVATRMCATGCDGRAGQCPSNTVCDTNANACSCAAPNRMCGNVCATCPSGTNATGFACETNSCVVSGCNPGYQRTNNNTQCTDINECADNNGGCGAGTCTNTAGSFGCSCTGVNRTCNGTCVTCPSDANAAGRTCDGNLCILSGCNAGYQRTSNNTQCADIDECANNNGGCGVGPCTNTPGSFSCSCTTPNRTCNGTCVTCPSDPNAAGQTCSGSTCILSGCNTGYQRANNNTQCSDINECDDNNGGCGAGTCTNTSGSFSCMCMAPNRMCGSVCAACPSDANAAGRTCSGNTCILSGCNAGYRRTNNNTQCEDIDECASNNGGCGVGTCTNTPGSFSCGCAPPNRMCGSACSACPADANATGFACSGTACVIASCASGYAVNTQGSACTMTTSNPFSGGALAIAAPDDIYNFGVAVALSGNGNTLVVGDDRGGADVGEATVYQRSGGSWNAGTTLTTPSESRSFGFSVAIAADGNTIAVGDRTGGEDDSGAVRVYVRSGNGWSSGTNIAPPSQISDFGTSVALSADGNILVIGDPDGGGSASAQPGNVTVYTRSNNTWSSGVNLMRPNGASQFGRSVAISGDGITIAVGDHDGNTDDEGAVTVYVRHNNVWSSGTSVTRPSQAFDFGYCVALSNNGNVLVVGDWEGVNDDFGRATVYARVDGVWNDGTNLTRPSGVIDFGSSATLSADGNTLVVGDRSGGATQDGIATVYLRTGNTWSAGTNVMRPSDADHFGYSVSLSADGSTLAVGDATGGDENLGAVSIYTR